MKGSLTVVHCSLTCVTTFTDSKVKAGSVDEVEGGGAEDVDGEGDAKKGQHLHHLLRLHHLGQRRLDRRRGEALSQHHQGANIGHPGVLVRSAEHNHTVADVSDGGDQPDGHVRQLELEQKQGDDG